MRVTAGCPWSGVVFFTEALVRLAVGELVAEAFFDIQVNLPNTLWQYFRALSAQYGEMADVIFK